MKNNIIISESEKKEILSKHILGGYKTILEEQVIQGSGDDPYEYKKENGQYYARLKGQGSWKLAKKQKTIEAIKTKIFKDIDKTTTTDTEKKSLKLPKIDTTTPTSEKDAFSFLDKKIRTPKLTLKNGCISVSKETCKKISSKSQTYIGKGPQSEGCARYMVKCLSEYDKQLPSNNAWSILPTFKNAGGKEIYNMFTDGSVNWEKLKTDLKKNNITSKDCLLHTQKGLHKDNSDSRFKKILTNLYPQNSQVNLSDLKLGDVVGMYYGLSTNFGKAFCQRAVEDRNFDMKGNFGDNTPFTFNTHVGFIGAIKDGVPIVFHNVEGTYKATPATYYMNKNAEAMITWVISDPEVESRVKQLTQY